MGEIYAGIILPNVRYIHKETSYFHGFPQISDYSCMILGLLLKTIVYVGLKGPTFARQPKIRVLPVAPASRAHVSAGADSDSGPRRGGCDFLTSHRSVAIVATDFSGNRAGAEPRWRSFQGIRNL
jgi:hypothetical protein